MKPRAGEKLSPATSTHLQPGVAHQSAQFLGRQEFLPVVRALRDLRRAFGERDHQQPRQGGPVRRRQDQQPARRERVGQPGDEAARVADMLDHLERGDQIVAAVQAVGAAHPIVDVEPLPLGVDSRGGDILRRGVDPGHRRAQPRERLGEQPGAAADIGGFLARERVPVALVGAPMMVDLVAYVAQPHRVEPVQHRRRALGVPPVGGQLAEMRRLARVDSARRAGVRFACLHHGLSLSGPRLEIHALSRLASSEFAWPAS